MSNLTGNLVVINVSCKQKGKGKDFTSCFIFKTAGTFKGKVSILSSVSALFNNYSDYSTIFTEPEANNCFSIIAQVITRATAFSFILRISSSNTSRNSRGGNFEN